MESRPETDAEACESQDMRAAAEALLQAQLQELGIPSDQIHPQLLNLITALTGVSSGTSSTVSANVDPRGSPQEPTRVTQHSGRAASEPVQETAKVAKLNRHDSVRSQRGGAVGLECLHGGPLEGVPVTRGNVSDFGQKQSQHDRQQQQQHEGELHAAAYAQQLYALLAQAQCPQVCPAHSLSFFFGQSLAPLSVLCVSPVCFVFFACTVISKHPIVGHASIGLSDERFQWSECLSCHLWVSAVNTSLPGSIHQLCVVISFPTIRHCAAVVALLLAASKLT